MAQRTSNLRPAAGRRPPRARARAPIQVSPVRTFQRGATLVALVGAVLVFTDSIRDVYILPKATIVWFVAAVLVGLELWRIADEGFLLLPWSRPMAAMTGVVGVLGLASLLGSHRSLAFVGEYGRDAGVLTYVAGLTLAITVVAVFDRSHVRVLAWFFVATSAIVISYGAVQALGAEPLAVPEHGPIVSTLGQPNFMGAYLGVALASFAWAATTQGVHRWLRLAAGGFVVVTLALIPSTHSFQAFFSVGASAVVLAIAILPGRVPTRWLRAAVITTLVALLVGGLALHGRIEHEVRSSMDERVLLWEGAGHLIRERPVLGWGMDGYAANFSRTRPREHAVRFGALQLADAPHSVPLNIAVSGGLVGLGAYLVLVLTIGGSLVQGLRRAEGERRLLLGLFGAVWAAYQVQSIVSIDTVTFVVVHLLTAGAIVALTRPDATRTVTLPWRGRPRGQTGFAELALKALAVLVIALLGWQAFRPLRADRASSVAEEIVAEGSPDAALPSLHDAVSLAPWNAIYWAHYTSSLLATGDQDAAVLTGQRAIEAAPAYTSYVLSEAQLLARLGRIDEAAKFFEQATRSAPNLPVAYLARAQFLVQQKRYADALPIARQAARLQPDVPEYLVTFGQALAGVGHDSEARKVFEHVVELQPGNSTADAYLHPQPQ